MQQPRCGPATSRAGRMRRSTAGRGAPTRSRPADATADALRLAAAAAAEAAAARAAACAAQLASAAAASPPAGDASAVERAGLSASPEPLQPRQVTVVLGRRPPPRTFRRPARLPEEVPAERRGFPRDPLALSSYAAAKALTLHITCLSSGEELLALLTRLLAPAGPAGSPPRLVPNAIHISAALSRLAKLEPASRWRDDPRTAGLVAAVGPLLPEVKPWSLVNMLWACAKLGIVPPWLDDWLVVSAPKLHEFVPQGLSNAIYSLGVLGVTRSRLPEPWLAAFWRASARVVTEGGKAGSPVERQFHTQHHSNVLYGLALARVSPPADWLASLLGDLEGRLGDCKPQALTNTLWSLQTLHAPPPGRWMAAFEAACLCALPAFEAQALASVVHSMAVLRHAPGAPFAAAFLSASVSEMPRFEAQHVSSAAWAVADLGLAPPPAWFHAWAVRATALAGDHTPQGLTNMLWALAVQGRYREAVTSLLWGTLLRQLTEWPPDGDPPSPIALHTLYCVWLAAREEAPGTLAQPQPWLLAALRHAWAGRRAEQLATSLSREHSEVMACLAQLGVAFQEERFCERSERHIDVAITQPGVRVALEVDGPHHFSATGARRHPVGSTRLRNRLLSAAGWTVLSVPLDSLPPVGPAARADWVAHLRAALRGVGVQVAAEVAR